MSWYLWGRKVGMEWNMEWYLQLVFHILHTFVLNVQLLRFTVRNIEHIEKSTQSTQIMVLNGQTNRMTNTQTHSVKILLNVIIYYDAKGQCTADKKCHFSPRRHHTTPHHTTAVSQQWWLLITEINHGLWLLNANLDTIRSGELYVVTGEHKTCLFL